MKVEWDENKRIGNLDDHGIDFHDGARIFLGPVIEADDARQIYVERRHRALGHFNGDYFMVAYTWRGDSRRIISAWKVDDDGRRRYAAILSGRS
jgi:uncharacterized protein